jgi:hypothetical protein
VLFRTDEYRVGEEENLHRRDEDEGESEDGREDKRRGEESGGETRNGDHLLGST